MAEGQLTIVIRRTPIYFGCRDIRDITFTGDSSAHITESCSESGTVFSESDLDFDVPVDSSDVREAKIAIQHYVKGDGILEIAPDSGIFQEINSIIPDLMCFESERSSSFSGITFSEERLDDLYRNGSISEDTYHLKKDAVYRTNDRKRRISELYADRSYPFFCSDDEIIRDHQSGLISDRDYDIFAWFRSRIFCAVPKDIDIISMKLKFSVWGLRLPGRYDTFEYLIDRDDGEIVKRSYCVHGTLFEGCGNYKAPDAAEHVKMSNDQISNIFSYLKLLDSNSILGKDYSEPVYDCAFFDLYTRFEERQSLHTKGTSEYPRFIRMLMYLMGQDSGSFC